MHARILGPVASLLRAANRALRLRATNRRVRWLGKS